MCVHVCVCVRHRLKVRLCVSVAEAEDALGQTDTLNRFVSIIHFLSQY